MSSHVEDKRFFRAARVGGEGFLKTGQEPSLVLPARGLLSGCIDGTKNDSVDFLHLKFLEAWAEMERFR